MSFVQRLRMANMFPIKSDLGNAKVPIEPDIDINSLLQQRRNVNEMPNGLQRVTQMSRPLQRNSTLEEPLQFGGVVGPQSNPGADILNRARGNAENLWESYKQPLNEQVSGMSNDEAHYQRYLDNALKTKTVESNIAQNERKINNDERRLDQADDRIDLSRDNRRLTNDLNQAKFDLTKSKEDTKKAEADNVKKQRDESIRTRALEAMGVLDQLMDKDGKLSPDTEWVTGLSGNTFSPTNYTPGGQAARAKIDRLKSLLTLDVLQELKSQSKTGATGFGAMNLKELGVLENAASMLDKRGMRESDYANELGRIRNYLTQITSDSSGNEDFEVLLDPNNVKRRVPKNQVEEFIKQGGRRQ